MSALAVQTAHSALQEQPLWLLARRIVLSRGFAKSKLLTSFLFHICEMHLTGRDADLTEQKIGERVFKRPEGYRPGDDNIVRNYARLLRQRLADYFEGEGQDEPVHIAVPRGGYVPLTIERGAALGASPIGTLPPPSWPGEELPLNPPSPPYFHPAASTPAWHLRALGFALALSLILSAFLAIALLQTKRHLSDSGRAVTPPANALWSALFSPTRDTIALPADTGLVIYQKLTRERIHLADYAGGGYEKDPPLSGSHGLISVHDLGRWRYTSFVDLQWIARLAQLPEVVKDRFKIRDAREASLDELKNANLILFGSPDSNPWGELFQKDLDFVFEYESADSNDERIRNLHPMPGEMELYATDHSDPALRTFGLIAVRPGLDGKGRVLLIQGINSAGTEAAAEYLFSEEMAALLPTLLDRNGNLLPFEILIQTSNIGANDAQMKRIALHIDRSS